MNPLSQAIIDNATQLDSQLLGLHVANSSLSLQLALAQNRINATVYDFLEEKTWLVAPGTAGNTGSTGSGQTGRQDLPGSMFGSFSLIPQGPFADRYNFLKFPPDPSKKNFLYEIAVMFPTLTDTAASQAVELDLQQVIAHKVYNTGVQLDFDGGTWRVWNRSAKPRDWVSTGTPIKRLTAQTWLHLAFMAHRNDDTIFCDSVMANGSAIPGALMSFPATTETDQPDMLNIGFQLDGNKSSRAYTVAVNRIRFTTW